jgi:hypothetical protein
MYIFALQKIKAYMKQKTLHAFIFFILIGCTLNAQIQKGSILLGGSFGYVSTDNGHNSSNTNINPRISYAIVNNSVIGITGNFNHSKSTYDGNNDRVSNTGYGASAFWRMYFPFRNKLGWYAEASGGVISGREKRKTPWGEQKLSSISYTVAAIPGVYVQALPNLIINASIGGIEYAQSKQRQDGISTSTKYAAFNVSLLSRFNFGVDFVLGKKS